MRPCRRRGRCLVSREEPIYRCGYATAEFDPKRASQGTPSAPRGRSMGDRSKTGTYVIKQNSRLGRLESDLRDACQCSGGSGSLGQDQQESSS